MVSTTFFDAVTANTITITPYLLLVIAILYITTYILDHRIEAEVGRGLLVAVPLLTMFFWPWIADTSPHIFLYPMGVVLYGVVLLVFARKSTKHRTAKRKRLQTN